NPTKKVFSLLEEFKKFALKGNVIDLAIGVIIGAAFAKIVDSLVKNIIMPIIGIISPDQPYKDWKIAVGGSNVLIGEFISDVLNFLIVALALYIFFVKFLSLIIREKKEEGPPPPTKEQELLMEIRDVLKAGLSLGEAPPLSPLPQRTASGG